MMDQGHMERLLTRCTETERAELSTKYNAYIRWLKAYQADSSRNTLAELDAAKRSLTATAKEVEGRIDAAAAEAEPLPHLKATVDFLKNDGWKIAKSKLYADARAGLIKVNTDGTVNEAEAIAYAHRYLKKIKAAEGEKDELYRDKAQAELDLLVARAEKTRFETDRERGLYLLKDEVRLQVAVKIGVFEAGFKNAVRINAEDLIHKVGGDPGRAQLFCTLFYDVIDQLLGEFGDMPEIDVLIVKQSPAGADEKPMLEL